LLHSPVYEHNSLVYVNFGQSTCRICYIHFCKNTKYWIVLSSIHTITIPYSIFIENMLHMCVPYQQHPYPRFSYNTIQYNTIQYNTIQYNTIQYNTIQYNTLLLYPFVKILQDL
jgi:hypothetical protein